MRIEVFQRNQYLIPLKNPCIKKPGLTEVCNFFFTLLFSCCVVSSTDLSAARQVGPSFRTNRPHFDWIFCLHFNRLDRSLAHCQMIICFNLILEVP